MIVNDLTARPITRFYLVTKHHGLNDRPINMNIMREVPSVGFIES